MEKSTIKKIINFCIVGVVLLPTIIHAATPQIPEITSTADIFNALERIRNILWAILAIIVIIMFIWAGITFVTAEGDPTKVQNARNRVLYGIIGIIVAALAGGILWIITELMK